GTRNRPDWILQPAGRDDPGRTDDPAATRPRPKLTTGRPTGRNASPPRTGLTTNHDGGAIRCSGWRPRHSQTSPEPGPTAAKAPLGRGCSALCIGPRLQRPKTHVAHGRRIPLATWAVATLAWLRSAAICLNESPRAR